MESKIILHTIIRSEVFQLCYGSRHAGVTLEKLYTFDTSLLNKRDVEKLVAKNKLLRQLLVWKPHIKFMQALSYSGDETCRRTSSTSPLRIHLVHIWCITHK